MTPGFFFYIFSQLAEKLNNILVKIL